MFLTHIFVAERRGPAAVDGNSFTDTTGISEPSESNVWSIGRANHITASWVNSDGSASPLHFLYYKGDGNDNFIVTANVDLTQATFGPGHAAVCDHLLLSTVVYSQRTSSQTLTFVSA